MNGVGRHGRRAWFPHLQALRALAVTGPVLMHLWPHDVTASALTQRLTGIGFLGVELFFVISGFLITGILLAARDGLGAGSGVGATFGSFYARRALRIFPVYWLLLVALAIAGVSAVRENFWWQFTYLWNVRVTELGMWPEFVSHFWSLAVEEQFYVAWPLLVLLAPRRALPWAMLATCIAAPLYRAAMLAADQPFHATVLLPACLDVLGLGGLLAWLWHERPAWRARFAAIALAAGALGTLAHLALYLSSSEAWLTAWPLARTSYALLFVALVDRAASGFSGPWRRLAEWQPVVRLGTISYGVYLLHPVTGALLQIAGVTPGLAMQSPLAWFLLQIAATIALAELSWRVLEEPLNRLRRHFPYPGDAADVNTARLATSQPAP